MTTGELIADLREAKGMNQTELAKKLEMNRSVLNRIELGMRPIRDDELIKFANFFNVSTDFLLFRVNPDDPYDYPRQDMQDHGYFLDPETVRIANEMKENPGRRVLFDATRKLSPEKIKQVKDFVDFITRNQEFSE